LVRLCRWQVSRASPADRRAGRPQIALPVLQADLLGRPPLAGRRELFQVPHVGGRFARDLQQSGRVSRHIRPEERHFRMAHRLERGKRESLAAIRRTIGRLFPGRPFLRCVLPRASRRWVGFAVLLPEGRLTIAFSQTILAELWNCRIRNADEILGAALVGREGPLDRNTRSLFFVRNRRSALCLTTLHGVDRTIDIEGRAIARGRGANRPGRPRARPDSRPCERSEAAGGGTRRACDAPPRRASFSVGVRSGTAPP